MVWSKKELNNDRVRDIAKQYDIDLLAASILERRGIHDPDEIKYYLEHDLRLLHNPFLFVEMEDVVDRIQLASQEGETIKIIGDRDVDGITSTVLLKEALQKLKINCTWKLPEGDEPYGLTMETVEQFVQEGGGLLVTVDCGISNTKEVKHAAKLGIDTIIIDHHLPGDEIPPALAIINPKMEDSGYPFRDLAGCGVTAKVIWALEFSKTDYYKQEFVLLNAKPGNETIILEMIKLENMIEIDRIEENIVPGMVNPDQIRPGDFLFDKQIVVYDKAQQEKMLKKVFGSSADIHLLDIAPKVHEEYPNLKDVSLLRMMDISKAAKYKPTQMKEIDILYGLFVDQIIKTTGLISELEAHLDLIALGTIADQMPLRNENRILVKRGLHLLEKADRKAIQELLLRQNILGKRLSTTDIGWQISPVINATGRLGVPQKAVELFCTKDDAVRSALADEIIGLNKNRKRLGEQGWNAILPKAEKSFHELQERMVIVADSTIHRGITGILAARLVNYFNVPAIVISYVANNLVGSARSTNGFNVKKFLEKYEDFFLDYGGHDYAAGFSLYEDELDNFLDALKEGVRNLKEEAEAVVDSFDIDAELPLTYMNPELHKLVELFEPYGESAPPLIFLVRGVRIAELDLIGKGEQMHVKVLIDSGTYKWPGVFWRAAERVGRDFTLGDKVDILFRLGRNYFQNKETLQLTILDINRYTADTLINSS